ncbi:AAA family ATPase [Bradyrhizobium oligotrophicum]|uniref:AAA family ATPase n=1 Tax=Bradyrhizobium oligotrophicum TaxID=44255 RepID=UPI003EBC30D9
MVPSLPQIAQALGGEVTGGQVRAPGPGHSPADRSLCIMINESGDDFVVNSFAGDDPISCKDYIRDRLGMPRWQPKKPNRVLRGSVDDEIEAALARTPAQVLNATNNTVEVLERTATGPTVEPRKLVCCYDYTDLDGSLIYQVLRWHPKAFTQRRPDNRGGWVTLRVFEGIARVPYRWQELNADMAAYPDAPIFCTEGEKDCDNVRALGLIATCVAGSVWTPEIAAVLQGRDVIYLEDNDKAGRDKAAKAGQALTGVAKTFRVARFTDLPDKADVTDWIALNPRTHNAEALVERCRDAPLLDLNPSTETLKDTEPLPFIDMVEWRVNEGVPPREWGVHDLFPRRNVALLSGEGAAGKTLLALQLGVAHALGRDWVGKLPEPGPFLYFGAEDETDEIHRRLADILMHYGVDFPDLRGNVHLLTFAGEDAVLGHADHPGLVRPTPLFLRLLKAVTEIKPILIVLDTSADVFAGNENDRSQVRQFVGLLRKMAIQANAYVLVNSHPSLTGINTGSGLSGSTGWHNSVRARAYLTTPKTDRDEEPDPDLRVLEFKKSNYSKVSTSIALRWQHGVWVPVAGTNSIEKMAKERTADHLFVALLDRFNDQGRNVSEKAAAKNYAPTEFAKEAEAKKHHIRKADFEAAMRRLFETSAIEVQPYGPPSRGFTRLLTR